jgi:choline-sulfatase
VPARASFATGLPVHRTGHWDNSFAYSGEPQSWAHVLADAGHDVVSIGKLHYRSADDDVGFVESIEPLYVVDGEGDILGCVREPLPPRWKTRKMAEDIGPGETAYTAYDRRIRDASIQWLGEKGKSNLDQPWTAFVSFMAPHFPLIAPDEYYALYANRDLMPEKPKAEKEHPWLTAFRSSFLYDNFDEEKTRIALASYYGLVSFMDNNVGQVLSALDASGMSESTTVLYVSDHGDNAGERGLWGKSTLYEESAGIPTIIAGPGIPVGKVSQTPVTLMDVYPTALEAAEIAFSDDQTTSLISLASENDDQSRAVFVEYHAAGSATGAFMIRQAQWKYIYYVDFEPQLFDLSADPDELNDLGGSVTHSDIRDMLHNILCSICDPTEVDFRAKSDQNAKIERHGGREAVVAKGGFGATPAPIKN